jgi:SAM-dependent methyltransferase
MEVEEYRRMAEVEQNHWWYEATRRLLRQLLAAELARGGRFLDMGAGTGATGSWLAEFGELVSCDFMPLALELNRERHEAAGFVNADVHRLPFASGSFDLVLSVTMLCHRSIPDPQVAVNELARVVRPGGMLVLWEPGVRRLYRAHDRVTFTARRFARRDLVDLVAGSGFDVERSSGAFSFLVPPAAVKSLIERGETSSDLDRNADGLGGALGVVAGAERSLLRRVDLPTGLSVFALGRAPG